MINQKDEILIQSILNGKNNEAETVLFNRYRKIIKDYVKDVFYKYPHNVNVDDHVSEILIIIFLKLDKYDSKKAKFKTWAKVIAKNYMIDVWRNGNNSIITCEYPVVSYVNPDNVDITNYQYEYPSGYSSDVTSFSKFEDNSTLTYLSSQISPNDYKMLDMKYNQGYNYSEIGNFFNMTSTTISNRVNYLKSKLKKENPEIIYEY